MQKLQGFVGNQGRGQTQLHLIAQCLQTSSERDLIDESIKTIFLCQCPKTF